MRKVIFVLWTIFLTVPLFGQSFNRGQFLKAEDVIPKNYRVLLKAEGDLNKDQKDDIVVIIEDTKKENYIKNESLGTDTLNINPRFLIVLLKGPKNTFSYNPKYKMPVLTEGDTMSTCLEDPLLEGGIKVEKGVVHLSVQYFMSCGSWTVTNKDFTFRLQNEQFELIGLESYSFHRASGEAENSSYNFSTGKVEITTGMNQFSDRGKEKKVTKKIKLANLVAMQDFRFDTEYQ